MSRSGHHRTPPSRSRSRLDCRVHPIVQTLARSSRVSGATESSLLVAAFPRPPLPNPEKDEPKQPGEEKGLEGDGAAPDGTAAAESGAAPGAGRRDGGGRRTPPVAAADGILSLGKVPDLEEEDPLVGGRRGAEGGGCTLWFLPPFAIRCLL